MTIIKQHGNWQACRDGKRYFVRDTRTGIQFNCNSLSHAVKKAQDNNNKEIQ